MPAAIDRRGRGGRPWTRVRRQVLERDGYRCQIRNPAVCTTVATCVDHIRGLAEGGDPLAPRNLRASCDPCNQARNRRIPATDTSLDW